MTVRAVLDSTCFIALERIERLELLPSLFDPIYAPPEVIDELGSSPVWLLVKEVGNRSLLKALSGQLDIGEAAAIALAMELGNLVVILDDKKARRVAWQMGLSVVGTVGVLLRAKREGKVAEVKSLLDSLDRGSFRISRELRREALRLAGEA